MERIECIRKRRGGAVYLELSSRLIETCHCDTIFCIHETRGRNINKVNGGGIWMYYIYLLVGDIATPSDKLGIFSPCIIPLVLYGIHFVCP